MSPALARRLRWLAVAGLVFNAFTWGVSWWPLRQLADRGLHALWLTGFIYALAAGVLLLARPGALGVLIDQPRLWWLVLASGATNACFNWAVSIGDVVRVVLLFYLMPLWAALLSHALLGERISARGALRVVLALGGAAVVLWPAAGAGALAAPAASTLLPDALGLLGGFAFALNNVLLRREAASPAPARALAMFSGGALVSMGLAAWLTGAGLAPAPPALAWGWGLAALGLAAWFLASNLALQYGAARLPANTTSVVMLSEVVFASVSALALGAGQLGPREALGAVMIVGAALLAAVQDD